MEVMVSALIFALVLIGMANIFVAGRRYILHARARMTSTELGRYFLDPLQLQVRQDEWDVGNCLSTGVGCGSPTHKLDNIDYTAEYKIDAGPGGLPATDVRRVTTTITWQELQP